MPDTIDCFYKGVWIATGIDMAFRRLHEHGLAARQVITMIVMFLQLRAQRMLIVNDARIVYRKYDFAFCEVASGEDTKTVNFRLRYDYINRLCCAIRVYLIVIHSAKYFAR